MNANLALERERPREHNVSWESKPFSVRWSADPFYDTERILEKQRTRHPANPPFETPESTETLSEMPNYPNWLIRGFTVGVIIFLIGLVGVAVSLIVRRTPFTDTAVAVMAVGMIVLAFAILKGREITDHSS